MQAGTGGYESRFPGLDRPTLPGAFVCAVGQHRALGGE